MRKSALLRAFPSAAPDESDEALCAARWNTSCSSRFSMSNNRPTVSIRGRRGMRFALSWRAAAAGPELPELPPQPKRAIPGNLRANRVHDGCFRLFHIVAIPVHVHWSVFVLLAAVAAASFRAGVGLFLGALAVCMIMLAHELGHAAFARRLGYDVSEIRLIAYRGRCCYDEPYSDFEIA